MAGTGDSTTSGELDFEVQVDRFDFAWRDRLAHGQPPPEIAEFLPPVASLESLDDATRESHRRLLIELVKVDLEYRWRPLKGGKGSKSSGHSSVDQLSPSQRDDRRRTLGAYLAEFPQLSDGGSVPVDLVAEEYRVRHRFGDRPSHGSILDRHPTQTVDVRAALSDVDRQLHEDSRAATASSFGGIDQADSVTYRADLGTIVDSVVIAPDRPRLADEYARPTDEDEESDRTPIERFLRGLRRSGALSATRYDEVEKMTAELDAAASPRPIAARLVAEGVLTELQADWILAGKGRNLSLGEYVILSKIGVGGMGAVYKARHRRMDRIVALKILSPSVTATADGRERFLREVRTAGTLRHPNIVLALDASEDGGRLYLVMEYVEGVNVRQIVRQRGPLGVKEAIDITLQAARGLKCAHDANIIHRDIKPDNLLVDAHGVVKILDLGLARRNDGVPHEGITLTGTGSIVGTPEFMAPEQAVDARFVDGRSDVYSLGCTLCFMLAGRPPFEGESVFEKLVAHRDQPVPSLKKLCRTANREAIPDDLEALFRRMMSKTPDERPPSMVDLMADFEQVLAEIGRGGSAMPSECDSASVPSAREAGAMESNTTMETSQRVGKWAIVATLAVCAAMVITRLFLMMNAK